MNKIFNSILLFFILCTSAFGVSLYPSQTNFGTITSGTWNGSTIGIPYGGTGSTSASGARTSLGIAIGTDVQAYDAELASIAVLTSASNKLPYFTGSGTASVADFSANARSFVSQNTSANMKGVLALNNVENTALSTWAGSTNLTTLGTIGTIAAITPTLNITNGLIVDTNTLYLHSGQNRVGIGTTAPTSSFQVEGTANIRQGIITAQGLFAVRASGVVLSGTTSQRIVEESAVTPKYQFEGLGLNDSAISIARNSADTGGPRFVFAKTRGTTAGSTTVASNGDEIGKLIFSLAGGNNTVEGGASIEGNVDAAVGANDVPGRLSFWTCLDGTDTRSERMRITNAGTVAIGTIAPATNQLFEVSGNAKFRSRVVPKTATFSITADEMGTILTMNSASPQQFQLPIVTTGNTVRIRNLGAGKVTVIKTGADTLDGNTEIDQYGEMFVSRVSGTKWATFGGNATVAMPGIHGEISTLTTSETHYTIPYLGTGMTITGVYQRCASLTTAGTFAVKRNGVTIQGLGAIVPSTVGSLTSTTTSTNNVCVTGDQITVVADGTLLGVLKLGLSFLNTVRL